MTRALSAALATVPAQRSWSWPLDHRSFDRRPELRVHEAEALDALGWEVRRRHGHNSHAPEWRVIRRLVTPLDEARESLGWLPDLVHHRRAVDDAAALVLRTCVSEDQAYWGWTPDTWARLIAADARSFTAPWPSWLERFTRPYVIALAYLVGGFVDFHRIGSYSRPSVARRVFGDHALEAAVAEVTEVLTGWGYRSNKGSRHGLRRVLCEVLLLNRSPLLSDLSGESLLQIREEPALSRWNSDVLHAIHRAVAALGYADPPPEPKRTKGVVKIDGAPDSWTSWVERWASTSALTPKVRGTYRTILAKAGRWLAAEHPDVREPGQWTRATCASWIAAVDRMSTGDFVQVRTGSAERWGKPLSPRTKAGYIKVLRGFLRDCQEWDWIPRRFDPMTALATPRSIHALIGPDPRVIADDIWAKVLWAGLNLEPDDIPTNQHGFIYPVELVRAVTLTWLFSGLRSDEIARLRLGCIRWQHEDVPVPGDSDEVLARDAVCLLDVPVHKTGTTFTKPVDPLLGQAVEVWQSIRPQQPPLLDRKTGEPVDFLFTFRARRVGKTYINETIIPALCHKAGVPTADVRGNITSHPARSTIASQLYNAKEPMTLFELQAWLGHRTPAATQHYAKITPLVLSRAYSDAGYFARNVRTIEVLVDRDAVTSGAAAAGEPWQYYDLGHGHCTYTFFEQCQHRMACARCDFYTPKDSSKGQLLEAKENLQRMLASIPLTDEERAAVDDGQTALDQLLERLADVPTPAGPTPRQLGIPTTATLLPIVEVNQGKTQ